MMLRLGGPQTWHGKRLLRGHRRMIGAPILPGTRVRTTSDILGTVERVEYRSESDEPVALRVRGFEAERHYRFPIRLVTGIHEETDQTVIHTVVRLEVDWADISHYRIAEHVEEFDPTTAAPDSVEPLHRLPLMAEQLTARTRRVQRGTVRLRKGVISEEQIISVPVSREELTVERIPADQFDALAERDDDETIIPVVEERLVIETRQVIIEYIRIRKRVIIEDQIVRGQVRRETFDASEQPHEGSSHADTPLLREL